MIEDDADTPRDDVIEPGDDGGLEVTTIRSTPGPERLVCQCARGDYFDGSVAESSYEELMEGIEYDDEHYEYATERLQSMRYPADWECNRVSMARTYALLERLFRRGHWGPFEHPQLTLAVTGASRACMAQITRHRQVTFDVQSQRYVDFSEKEDSFKLPQSLVDDEHFSRETGVVDLNDLDREFYADYGPEVVDDLFALYDNMVQNGVPKEDARFFLPIGTTVNWTMSMNARTLLHIANMRGTGAAQWEARALADLVLEEFEEWMPLTYALWEDHGPMELSP